MGRLATIGMVLTMTILPLPAAAQTYPSVRGPSDTPKYSAAGSVYVPLTSWVYVALERLAALRYITSEFRGIRPWTRTECARQTQEAGERIQQAIRKDRPVSEIVASTYEALEREFSPEMEIIEGGRNRSLQMESVYARTMSISGPALDDSFHFGQTIDDDYGRPDREGTNMIAGGAARATDGAFFAYADEEFQHAPSQPAYSPALQAVVVTMDAGYTDYLPHPTAPINQWQPLDTYAGFNFKNWQVSYGRQSLWWGTSESGPLLYSDNAEPVNMLRISSVMPFRLPSILGIFGPMHVDFMVGRLAGHVNPGSTWNQETRVSFKMTQNFEFGFNHEAMFGGAGHPSGIVTFFKAFFPIPKLEGDGSADQNLYKQSISYDFLYRFKRFVTFYAEMDADDAPTPFIQPSRDSVNTGVYFARLPRISEKFDLRLESVYTASPLNTAVFYNDGFLHYFNPRWGGLFNDGDILGNSIGRDGKRYQGWLTYNFSPTSHVQLYVRHTQISPDFVPSGATWTDYTFNFVQNMRSGFYISSFVQLEHMHYPILYPTPRTNLTASLELGYTFGERRR
jgi:hypothetical protein